MNYEKAIAKFREIYRPTTQDDSTLGVYVHNPFITKGVKFDPHRDSELYERYYDGYLPRVAEPFLPVIVARNVVSYFFGGSTHSLMSADTMRAVFRLFPDMARAPSRTSRSTRPSGTSSNWMYSHNLASAARLSASSPSTRSGASRWPWTSSMPWIRSRPGRFSPGTCSASISIWSACTTAILRDA